MGYSVILGCSVNVGIDYITPDSLKDIDSDECYEIGKGSRKFINAYSWCEKHCSGKWTARSLYDYFDDFLNKTSFDFEYKEDALQFKLCFGGRLRTY